MPLSVIFHSAVFRGYAHAANEMPNFVSLECRSFLGIMLLVFLVTQVLFLCIFWQYCHIPALWKTMKILSVCSMYVSHARYNVKHCGRHETILLETCLVYL